MFLQLNFVDFILTFILILVTCLGIFFGLIRVVGAIATIIIGIVTAGLFFKDLALTLEPYLFDNPNISKIVAFLLIYWLVSLILSVIVAIANKLFKLPFLKTVNRLLGGVFSFLGCIIVLAIFLHLFRAYAWSPEISALFSQSILVNYLMILGKYLSWLIPGI